MKAALVALGLLAAPAVLACDPAEMERIMTEICEAAAGGAEAAVDAARPQASAQEAAQLDTQLAALRRGCTEGDPVAAAREAPALARIAGRIEGRDAAPRPARHTPTPINPKDTSL